MDVRIGAPTAYQPGAGLIGQCREIAEQTGARITVTEDPLEAVRGVDFVHTDVWVSMGEPVAAWAERIGLLRPYQVNAQLMAATGNAHVKLMHCLPAFHDTDTAIGRDLVERYPELAKGVEVTDEVFESPASVVFDQAENRVHTIKALLVATLR
jgi:ornithine carbamoyltransferase